MMRRKSLFIIPAMFCLIAPFAGAYYSNNYGDYVGMTVKFNQVTETTYTDNIALYRAPEVKQDSLEFNNLLFVSYASGAGGIDLTDGTLETTIEAKPNAFIDAINFTEWGDTTLGGTGTANTYTSINNSILIKVREIDGAAPSGGTFTFSVDMVFTPDDGWNLYDDGAITGLDWSGSVTIDVTAKIREMGYSTGLATLVDLTMDNTLVAASEAGTTALILKKETDGLKITPIIVPEPMTVLLLGLGGLLLRKRK